MVVAQDSYVSQNAKLVSPENRQMMIAWRVPADAMKQKKGVQRVRSKISCSTTTDLLSLSLLKNVTKRGLRVSEAMSPGRRGATLASPCPEDQD